MTAQAASAAGTAAAAGAAATGRRPVAPVPGIIICGATLTWPEITADANGLFPFGDFQLGDAGLFNQFNPAS